MKLEKYRTTVHHQKCKGRMRTVVDVTETLDVTGEVCPYPDVKSKRKVKKMNSGEILRIIVDYPLSAERIPETMRKLGHEVMSYEKTGDSEWEIMIEIK